LRWLRSLQGRIPLVFILIKGSGASDPADAHCLDKIFGEGGF
jgi:hypothetical protein